MTNYYVYYRVEPGRLDAVQYAVQELFKAVQRETGVKGRWMRRRDDPATCMEVYEGVHACGSFEAHLANECERLGLQQLIGAARRQEIFVAADTVDAAAGNR